MLDLSSHSLTTLRSLVTLEASSIRQQKTLPFKDRVEFDCITDILNRKLAHHVQLHLTFSVFAIIPYLKALLLYLNSKSYLKTYYQPHLIYLASDEINELQTFQHLIDEYVNSGNKRLCVVYHASLLGQLESNEQFTFFHHLQSHPNVRLLVIKEQSLNQSVSMQGISPQPLSQADYLDLLKYYTEELESFHQIAINDECLHHAMYLANRYLPQSDRLAHTLLLLDSATAREHQIALDNKHSKILSTAALNDVISCLTRIPATHLQKSHFNLTSFNQVLQQEILGQSDALNWVCRYLQQALAGIHIQPGPMLRLLMFGPPHTGKKSFIHALVKQLFDQPDVVYFAQNYHATQTNLLALPFKSPNSPVTIPLQTLITQKPYAVLCIEAVDQLPLALQTALMEILTLGYLTLDNQLYDFQQSMMFLTVESNSHCLQIFNTPNPVHSIDTPFSLAEFVENKRHDSYVDYEECIATATQTLSHLPFARDIPIIPFLPLNAKALETIIRRELQRLVHQLATQYHIELGFAPEVIQYLLDQVASQQQEAVNIEAIMLNVYHILEKVLLNRQHIKKLFLQLNETGNMLRCA